MTRKNTARILAGLGATAALVVAAPLAASAHVVVNPDSAAAGSYATVNFLVPTESDTASTVGLEVTLPTDHPFLYVGYQPVPGWTIEVTTAPLPEPVEVEGAEVTEAPATITFTADPGAGIAPEAFQQFPVVLGPVPADVDEVVLPAVQTYDDGSVVEWVSTPAQMADDDSLLPAPVLTVSAAEAGGHGHDDAETPDAVAAGEGGTAASSSDSSSGLALGLGISGLVVGAVGAVIGVVALLRTRRSA